MSASVARGSDPVPGEDPAPPRGLGSGRSGRIRALLRRIVRDRKGSAGWTLELALWSEVADGIAGSADAANDAGDFVRYLRAVEQLERYLVRLCPGPVGGGPARDGSRDGGRLLELVDGPPTLGDAADG